MRIRILATAACAALSTGLPAAAQTTMADMDHADHDMAEMADPEPVGHDHVMPSALGSYPIVRDATGTSWQPDASTPMSDHGIRGQWTTMSHATLNLVYDSQGGPRGDNMAFVSGMIAGMANRQLGQGVLGVRAMVSPDAFMGKEGYPLLLQAGETADGVSHLVDRQHPHDLFMELSASYSHPVGQGSAFIYAGLPGEPAFGPPAFMHRQAGMDSPEAPLSHHWLDSTHITFGVLTAGYAGANWKVEASSFRGREPDQDRYDIESPKLDSWSGRISINPTPNWAMQISYAELTAPEQLEPLVDDVRASASVLYASERWSATLAYGTKKPTGGDRADALLAEAAFQPNANWTLFARAERVEQTELDPGNTLHAVGKLSAGAVRDFQIKDQVRIGIGGLLSTYDIPAGLSAYGSPTSGMAFVRLKVN